MNQDKKRCGLCRTLYDEGQPCPECGATIPSPPVPCELCFENDATYYHSSGTLKCDECLVVDPSDWSRVKL